MYLIRDNNTRKYYKCGIDIRKHKVSMFRKRPFLESGRVTESDFHLCVPCIDKFPEVEVVCEFDGRIRSWMRDCEWFTWLSVINGLK